MSSETGFTYKLNQIFGISGRWKEERAKREAMKGERIIYQTLHRKH